MRIDLGNIVMRKENMKNDRVSVLLLILMVAMIGIVNMSFIDGSDSVVFSIYLPGTYKMKFIVNENGVSSLADTIKEISQFSGTRSGDTAREKLINMIEANWVLKSIYSRLENVYDNDIKAGIYVLNNRIVQLKRIILRSACG